MFTSLEREKGRGKGRRWRRKHVYSSSSSASTRDRFGGDGELLRSRGSAREPEPARTNFAVGGAVPKKRESGGDVLRAFYRGFDLKLLRAVPASAVSFFAYEEARRWLERE